jgi:hypothetical protein
MIPIPTSDEEAVLRLEGAHNLGELVERIACSAMSDRGRKCVGELSVLPLDLGRRYVASYKEKVSAFVIAPPRFSAKARGGGAPDGLNFL